MAEHTSQSPADEHALDLMLQQAAAGDGQAWSALVRSYTPRVFGLLLKNCKDSELAEELTQDTFVTVAEKLTSSSDSGSAYRELGRFQSWLFRIAMNRLRDEMRRRKRQARPTDMSPAASARGSEENNAGGWSGDGSQITGNTSLKTERPEVIASRKEQVELLKQAVDQLDEADREIVYLRHTAGLSFAEIAETLEKPIGTVLARSHRAIKKLRGLMQRAEP